MVTKKTIPKKISNKKLPKLKLTTDRSIAMDFAQRAYQKFDKMIKSIILFGSTLKNKNVPGSDIDIMIIIDDATIKFDDKLIAWYRDELKNIIQESKYKKDLHINTIKLTTWWKDLTKGDPTIINIIRYGETLIDFGGFFNPLKIMLQEGRIKSTPEAIYTCLNRVTGHIIKSKQAEVNAIEGCYWAMVDSAHALLMAINVSPPSPEQIPVLLKENFVDRKLLKIDIVRDFNELHELHKKMMHGEIRDIEGKAIDTWQDKSEQFYKVSMTLIEEILKQK